MDHDDDFWLGDHHDHPLDDHDPFAVDDHDPFAVDDHDPFAVEDDRFVDGYHGDEPGAAEPELAGYQVDLDLDGAPLFDGGFPPELHLPDLPDPVDGPPWIDVTDLAIGAGEYRFEVADPGPDALAAYAGEPGADWAALRAAEDPATAALARFWSD